MKKTFFLAALLMAFSFAQAQQNNSVTNNQKALSEQGKGRNHNQAASPEDRAQKYVAKLNEAVNLDARQTTRVKSLALDHFTTMETVRKNAAGNKEQIKAEAEKSRAILKEGLKKVLSPAQFEKWRTYKNENPQHTRAGQPSQQPADDELLID